MSLSHLRPLTAGEILDGAFVLYRRHFATFFVTALVPFLPVMAVWLLLILSGSATEGTVNLLTNLSSLVTIYVGAALIHQVSQAVTDGAPSRAAGYRRAGASFWRLIGVGILSGLAAALAAIAFLLPGIAVFLLLYLATNVVVVEQRGVSDSLERSWDLSRPEWRRVTAVLLVAGAVFFTPFLLLVALETLVESESLVVAAAGAVLGELLNVLVYPFLAAASTLLYYDCLVRREGVDLQAAAAELEAAVPA